MSHARIALGLVLFAAASASAQSLPPITKAKQSATRAVDATNAHTTAMTSDSTSAAKAQASRRGQAADSGNGLATQASSGSAAVPKTPERPERPAFEREIFDYQGGGRRDPFVSLMSNGDLRPVITDLQVVGIVFDESGRTSVAILKDLSSKEQYRVRVGQSVGRIRVARIDTKSVTFTIEEFGFSRQETLALVDPKQVRTQ